MRTAVLLASLLSLGASGLAFGQAMGPPSPFLPGYLPKDALDETRFLPAPPVEGSPRYEADRAIFRDTRAFVGDPRFEAATADAEETLPAVMARYSCALGAEATPQRLPVLARLTAKAFSDVYAANDVGKPFYKRVRPPGIDPGQTCHPLTAADMTRDYPSGHASRGWLFALLLTELAPDRADALLTRGRSFGESRVVCGVHNASAIEAGRVVGASVLARLHGDPVFRDDLQAARAEMTVFRAAATPPDPALCAAQAALLEPSPFR